MIKYPAYAAGFEFYPGSGPAYDHLHPLLGRLQRVTFTMRVASPDVNQGQVESDFDTDLEAALIAHGALSSEFRLPPEIPQEMDFAFRFNGRTVAVEIEKANREKILRDILKCHMYLHAGADFTVIGLPRNYPHKHGAWDLFDFGVQRLRECATYGFGSPDRLGRILLLGYTQYSADGETLSQRTRARMRQVS